MLTVSLHLAAMMVGHGLLIDEATDPSGERLYPFPSPDFWMGMLQGALQYVLAFAFVILFTRVAVREREARAEVEHLAAELREANRQLREYVTQAEELATVTERNRLAREIHDGLGHYFTAINMQIQAGRAVLEYDLSLGIDALAKAQGLAQEGLAEVRRSVAALRSSPLDNRSLPEAVGDLVDEVRAAGIATSFDVRGEVRSLSPQVELALYRAAQEGMTNMCKHAQASNAEVVLDYSDASAVRLVVGDSGVGSADPTGGYGLIGVRERVHLLGGEVHVETVPGEGFVLKVKVPG
ncbi:MAG: sensor histidine kinase [Anaerolineae bacterium]|nr:sensor histidine kinase [Anaerolineae bacterium]